MIIFKEKVIVRLLMALLGTIVLGFGCGLLVLADLGIDPYNALVRGINKTDPFSYGMTNILITAFFLIFTLVANKKYIGISTIINLFMSGYIIQFTLVIIPQNLFNCTLLIKIVTLLFGLTLISIGSSLYYTAELGVSGYDAIALIFAERSKIPFRVCRVIIDGFCVTSAFFLGTKIGITTVITALYLGPAIDWLNRNFSEQILNRPYGSYQDK